MRSKRYIMLQVKPRRPRMRWLESLEDGPMKCGVKDWTKYKISSWLANSSL